MADAAGTEGDLARAVGEGFARIWTQYSIAPASELHEDPDATWYLTGLPDPYFNGVVRSRFDGRSADRRMEAILERFRERRLPSFWFVGPGSEPGDLADRLRSRGFTPLPELTGMARSLRALPPRPFLPNGVSIDPVHDPAALGEWVRVVADGFGAHQEVLPGFVDLETATGYGQDLEWVRYLARVEGRPSAAVALFVMEGVAGLESVATVPSARRLGLASFLTLHALHVARARGCRLAVLGASPMGVGVYRRLGFERVCDLGFFVRYSTP